VPNGVGLIDTATATSGTVINEYVYVMPSKTERFKQRLMSKMKGSARFYC
jgi:hypothetical protein